ncbi:N-acetylmuramoyl-L-alanine amidase family protein [Clostridium sp. 'White wine YQ']|uniref:N-acetylmuramoyl-L-alanine amidase family protein n=1 Tax=Clostridium sp. 'White wine YQ' TaxID=3027474 RepID=UPI002366CBEC|nr:N-acetylmuramoyl-L-alanine amidase [Clostridium sp. 'White wine YQ']MDD7793586.1 N-acetylmuramoyl-L-alanine amidase [Clostridium sp. 'White wine YQ']
MKKPIAYLIIIAMTFTFLGCSKAKEETPKKQEDTVQATQKDTTEEKVQAPIVESTNEDSKSNDNKNTEEIKNNNVEVASNKNVTQKKKVVIDPGHGIGGNKGMEKTSPDSNVMKIKDPGGAQGINSRIPEYVVAMQIALKLKTKLENSGIEVVMTKTDNNQDPGNIDRAEVGNNNNADLVIRIHCDSADDSSANGATMLVPAAVGYAKNIKDVSKKDGGIILSELIKFAGMKNRGISERSDLTGFNWSKVPVVLVEAGFMSNPNEDRLLSSGEYQDKIASGLSSGIIKALN